MNMECTQSSGLVFGLEEIIKGRRRTLANTCKHRMCNRNNKFPWIDYLVVIAFNYMFILANSWKGLSHFCSQEVILYSMYN